MFQINPKHNVKNNLKKTPKFHTLIVLSSPQLYNILSSFDNNILYTIS